MVELSFEYMNKLASQTLLISALLCGFCLTILVLLLEDKSSSKIMSAIFNVSIVAIGAFLISIFATNDILLRTTVGFPFEVDKVDLARSRAIGGMSFVLGTLSVLVITSLSGWTKSKKTGMFSTFVGIISLIFFFQMIS